MPSLPNHITLFLVLSPYHPTGAPRIQIFPRIQSPADRKRGIPEEGNFDRCWEYVFLLVQERIPYPFSLRDGVIAGGQSCTGGIKGSKIKNTGGKKKKKKACRLVWGLTQLIEQWSYKKILSRFQKKFLKHKILLGGRGAIYTMFYVRGWNSLYVFKWLKKIQKNILWHMKITRNSNFSIYK